MGSFTWTIPSPSIVSPPSGGSGATAAVRERTFGFFDQELDPNSRDYIDTDDGAWSETEDSRTAVMLQLEIEYGRCWWDPDAGSRIAELLRSGDPVDATTLAVEVRRALGLLVAEGTIADLLVEVANEEYGLVELHLSYTDRASGQSVDGSYSPYGGLS